MTDKIILSFPPTYRQNNSEATENEILEDEREDLEDSVVIKKAELTTSMLLSSGQHQVTKMLKR